MNSMDGAINGTNEMAVSPHITTRSISDHTLKSVTLLDDSFGHQMNGKCEALHVMNGHKMPSYVGISCAISGYSDYNRYCSSLRNSCTRRDISVALKDSTQQPVNHLNDSLNRKNSLISEALITSRHNVNDDIEINGTEPSIDFKTNDINSNLKSDLNNKNNSLLEQRIASLYGQGFANDWRESRTKTRHKLNGSCIFNKQRSPSCPPTQRQTLSQTRVNSTNDKQIDTQKKRGLISDRQSITNERIESIERQISEKTAENSQMTAKVEENIMSLQSISITDSCPQSSAQSIPSNIKDGNWFLNELNTTTDQIKEKIDLTEEMLNNQDNSLMGEDMSGKLRAAIGKANLLINQKFKQFRELCLKNISQNDSEQFITTNDDLEGFWDMVYIQVIDINDTFEEINKLCASGWKKETPVYRKKATLTPTKARSRKSTPKGSPDKSCDESNSDRDSERRNRLREAKRRARLKASQTDDEITIFIPSNNKD